MRRKIRPLAAFTPPPPVEGVTCAFHARIPGSIDYVGDVLKVHRILSLHERNFLRALLENIRELGFQVGPAHLLLIDFENRFVTALRLA